MEYLIFGDGDLTEKKMNDYKVKYWVVIENRRLSYRIYSMNEGRGKSINVAKKNAARNVPRTRGRTGKAKLGDAKSVIEAIQDAEDKFDVKCANSLMDLYKMMEDIAWARGDFSGMKGKKDQALGIKYMIDRAQQVLMEQFMDELEDEDKDDNTSNSEEESFSTGISLMSLTPPSKRA